MSYALKRRPRGSIEHRRESARTPGERSRMPGYARFAAADDPAYFSRIVPWAESERSARTYVPSCRLIFRLKSHIRQTPRAPRDRLLCETRLL